MPFLLLLEILQPRIMRLLEIKEDGGFGCVQFIGRDTPPYAILSHTWGADDDEVTFGDLTRGTDKSKAGYRKLAFCANQAVRDDLRFFWVDTCCIDKSSSTELSEAIQCMFRWYRDAKRCYVYLSDVTVDGLNDELSEVWKPSFRRSKWFTRGWTLQELVAPMSVEFFSKEGRKLGSKRSLEQDIEKITGIPIAALRNDPLSGFDVEKRFSWATKRQTKREEDAAYALLGIFDVNLSIRYGEGRKDAFERLRRKINRPLRQLQAHQQRQEVEYLKTKVQTLLDQMSKRPKEIGFPWETGLPEDELRVDDGLGAEYLLPVDLCKTPKVIFLFSLSLWRDSNTLGT